jgi:hypothetical protein
MKLKLVLPVVAVLLAAWLGMWVTDTGLLVYSAETRLPIARDCRYLVGVTVLKRIEPLVQRCEVLRTLGK